MIALLIVIGLIGFFWAVPSPPVPRPETKTVVIDARTVHVHQRVEVKVLVLSPAALAVGQQGMSMPSVSATRALERYDAPKSLSAPRTKIVA